MHPTLHDHYRVPITYINGKYEVFVGDDHVRIFDETDLPDVIKAKLTMVRASTVTIPTIEDPMLIGRAYECPLDSPMFEIGWQPCKDLYVVVIPTKDLTYLRGEEYHGIGFMTYAHPTHSTLDEHILWLQHRKEKSKTKLKRF